MVKVTFHWDLDVHCPCSSGCVLTKSMVPRVLIGALKRGKCFEKDWTACCEINPATIKIMTCGGKISLRSCGERKKDEHHYTHSGGISGEPNYPIEKGDYSFFVIFVPSETPLPWEIFTLLSISCLQQNLTFHKFFFNRPLFTIDMKHLKHWKDTFVQGLWHPFY